MTDTVKQYLENAGYSSNYLDGLKAVKNEHRDRIKVRNPRNLLGSMDIDKACQKTAPDDFRWDYLIVVRKEKEGGSKEKGDKENLALVEIHGAARSSEVGVVIQKKEWLIKWLSRTKLSKNFKKKFIWLATGGTRITPHSREARTLARAGISFPRKVTPQLDGNLEYS